MHNYVHMNVRAFLSSKKKYVKRTLTSLIKIIMYDPLVHMLCLIIFRCIPKIILRSTYFCYKIKVSLRNIHIYIYI